ncbi:OLC1v1012063C1 [Oldenlandia corymbosa var. corymbosa]|uniref:OLC1v1012063C1 n=1 Tax=Oldenlandia corymbosa var. corymbosa TaxID=529605 RepID=A0AAV1DYH1_OLDCO|nr:OLC1v1012063C1 [Oldenlandia corymbosa var. corymbosa]
MAVSMSDILLFLLSVTTYVLFLYSTKLFLRRRNSEELKPIPPGKTDWPFFRESQDLYSKMQGNAVHEFVLERCNKYSSKIFKTSVMGQTVAVFSGAEGNKFLFSNQPELLTHWVPGYITKLFPSGNDGIKDDAKQILAKRLFFKSTLKGDALRSYVRIFDATAKQQLLTVQTDWMKPEEVSEMARRYTFTSGCKIFLGIGDKRKIDELEEYINMVEIGLTSKPINLPGTAFHRAIKTSKNLFRELGAIIRQRKTETTNCSSSGDEDFDFISQLIQSSTRDNRHGLMLGESQMGSFLAGLLMGSYSGLHTTITQVIKHLAEFPQVYQLVLKEQEEIASSKGVNETLQWEDVRKMKYSWNVVCETLRLSALGIGGFKEAVNGFEYGGYTIPKGWKLQWSAAATHRNPEYFPDPDKFDPSRFEGDGPAPYTFVPFGGGIRMCPGNEYARFAILVFIHNVVINSAGTSKLLPPKLGAVA